MKTKYIQPQISIVQLNQGSMIAASQNGLTLDLGTGREANVEDTQEGGGYGLTKNDSFQWDGWE